MKTKARVFLESVGKMKVFTPAIILAIIGFLVAYQFVGPAPPREIVMASGSSGGAYASYGNTYAEILAHDGITLKLVNTSGSVENLKLLEDESSKVDLAFVQGGLASLATTDRLVTLGSLFFEPLWIFHREQINPKRLVDLQGLQIAVGAEGSGTKALVQELLTLNGVVSQNSTLLSANSQDAAAKLLQGDIDVACFVANPRSKTITTLLHSEQVKLMGIDRAEAYTMRYKYLHVLNLAEGVIDMVRNLPPQDQPLIASAGQLVASSDLHPALIGLLLQAAEEIHYKGGLFESEGEFPTPRFLDFRLSDEAKRYYKHGPPFFQRYLPFWIANFLSRMKIMLLPLLALLFPLFKIMPAIYRWRMRSRIYRWYAELEEI
ncbi:MAG: TAXI family TRAP transporter solute-binding subunit, partial [Desulfuromusa sp.]|nr:TAXI family TRAP transporter solute-binding subunit [Desulfuromusa sp.]